MYYASPVWLNSICSKALWNRLKSFGYRVFREATCDFKRKMSEKVPERKCKRATPEMWGAYSS